jgi:hypothetical protein
MKMFIVEKMYSNNIVLIFINVTVEHVDVFRMFIVYHHTMLKALVPI